MISFERPEMTTDQRPREEWASAWRQASEGGAFTGVTTAKAVKRAIRGG